MDGSGREDGKDGADGTGGRPESAMAWLESEVRGDLSHADSLTSPSTVPFDHGNDEASRVHLNPWYPFPSVALDRVDR
jgi:hypothetical protein